MDINLLDGNHEKITKLTAELDKYYSSISHKFEGMSPIFRFKNIFKTINWFIKKEFKENYTILNTEFIDKYADLFGILSGYLPREIARLCLEREIIKYNLLK